MKIIVDESPFLREDGKDIHTTVYINPLTPILGGKTDVSSLDGKVSIKIPEGTEPGEKIKFSGMGVDGGNLIVTINYSRSLKLFLKQKNLLRLFLE